MRKRRRDYPRSELHFPDKETMAEMIEYGSIVPSLSACAIAPRVHQPEGRVQCWLRALRKAGWIPPYAPPSTRDYRRESLAAARRSSATANQVFAETMAGRRYENAPYVERSFVQVPRPHRVMTLTGCSAAMCSTAAGAMT